MPEDIIIKRFNSPRDYVEWASNAPCLWKGKLESRNAEKDPEWAGTRTYEEAYKLALYGWPEGINLLTKKLELAEQIVPPTTIPKVRYDVAGFYPHPGRAAAGEIFNMASPVRPDTRTKQAIKMRFDIARCRNVDSDTIITFGAAVCSYINALEISGWPVELTAVAENTPSCCGRRGPSLSFQFPLKKAGFNLSLGTIVFWLAHPAAYRRIEFSAKERLDVEQWYSGLYGCPLVVTEVNPNILHFNIDDARGSLERDLDTIRRKHLSLLGEASPLTRQVSAFNFG